MSLFTCKPWINIKTFRWNNYYQLHYTMSLCFGMHVQRYFSHSKLKPNGSQILRTFHLHKLGSHYRLEKAFHIFTMTSNKKPQHTLNIWNTNCCVIIILVWCECVTREQKFFLVLFFSLLLLAVFQIVGVKNHLEALTWAR